MTSYVKGKLQSLRNLFTQCRQLRLRLLAIYVYKLSTYLLAVLHYDRCLYKAVIQFHKQSRFCFLFIHLGIFGNYVL